jgi:hypothetical protein
LSQDTAIIIRDERDEYAAMGTRAHRDRPPAASDDSYVEQVRPPQPRAEIEMMKQFFDMMKQQQEQHAQQMNVVTTLMQQIAAPTNPRATERSQTQVLQPDVGSDINQLMFVGDAIRGTDDPRWRIAPGLTMPKYIVEKFKIVSIPHLLFKEDSATSRMVKVPKGEAMKFYKSILPNCKMAFPNQHAVAVSRGKGKNDHGPNAAMTPESAEGVRAQLDRAERMFAALLEQLDHQDSSQLPSTREEWMIFIDAGASVLDLYATLA